MSFVAQSSQYWRFFGGPGWCGLDPWKACSANGLLLSEDARYHSGSGSHPFHWILYRNLPHISLTAITSCTSYSASPSFISSGGGRGLSCPGRGLLGSLRSFSV